MKILQDVAVTTDVIVATLQFSVTEHKNQIGKDNTRVISVQKKPETKRSKTANGL